MTSKYPTEYRPPKAVALAQARPRRMAPSADAIDWHGRAKCKGQTALFYPPAGLSSTQVQSAERAAKAVCEGCPVLAECRDWALQQREPYGVWGAMTAKERKTLLTRLRKRAAAAAARQARLAQEQEQAQQEVAA